MADDTRSIAAPRAAVELHAPGTMTLGRRAMLRSLTAAVGAGFAFPFVAEGHPVHDHLLDQDKVAAAEAKAATLEYSPKLLDAHQLETLQVLADRIVPGSTEARVAPFLDSLLSVSSMTNQRRFLGSLGAFEMLAIEEHRRAWKALTPTEQDELLTRASNAAPAKQAKPGASSEQQAGTLTIRDFFDDLRGWIAGAYYSSEVGLRELGWTGQMIFDRFPGCEHLDGHRA